MMNRILLFLFFWMMTLLLFSQEKVLKRSGEPKSWLNAMEAGYIITSARASELDVARMMALDNVKEAIVRSVAEQVQVITEQNTKEINGDVNSFLSTYRSDISTRSDKIPFLNGISESKVDDWYWEKLKNKKTREVFYRYYIRYPFPEFELKKLVSAYEKYDDELSENLYRQLDSIRHTRSIDALFSAYGNLRELIPVFSDRRKDMVNSGLVEFKGLMQSMRVSAVERTPGRMVVVLKAGNRTFHAATPAVSSNCAVIEQVKTTGEETVVRYNYDNCKPGGNNYLKFVFKAGNMRIRDIAGFDITLALVELEPAGNVEIKMIGNLGKLYLPVKTEYNTEFTITRIELEFPAGLTLIFENQEIFISGKGMHAIVADLTLDPEEVKVLAKARKVSYRIIYFRGGESGAYRFYKAGFRLF